MESLKRTRVGNFKIEDAVTLREVERLVETGDCEKYIITPDSIFMEYEGAVVKPEAEHALLNGNKLSSGHLDRERQADLHDGDFIRVYNGKREFKAVYVFVRDEDCFKPYKMFL